MTLTTRTLARMVRLQVQALVARGIWMPGAEAEAKPETSRKKPIVKPKGSTSGRSTNLLN
jgi:hypothetical protein